MLKARLDSEADGFCLSVLLLLLEVAAVPAFCWRVIMVQRWCPYSDVRPPEGGEELERERQSFGLKWCLVPREREEDFSQGFQTCR